MQLSINNWKIYGDLKVTDILMGLQGGFTKYSKTCLRYTLYEIETCVNCNKIKYSRKMWGK